MLKSRIKRFFHLHPAPNHWIYRLVNLPLLMILILTLSFLFFFVCIVNVPQTQPRTRRATRLAGYDGEHDLPCLFHQCRDWRLSRRWNCDCHVRSCRRCPLLSAVTEAHLRTCVLLTLTNDILHPPWFRCQAWSAFPRCCSSGVEQWNYGGLPWTCRTDGRRRALRWEMLMVLLLLVEVTQPTCESWATTATVPQVAACDRPCEINDDAWTMIYSSGYH